MNDEQLVLFRKILNIRKYSDSTIKNYFNALLQFAKWNIQNEGLNKDVLFRYVEHLTHLNKSYSYIKNSIMSLMLYSELVLGKKLKNDFLSKIKRSSKLPDVLSIIEVKNIIASV